MQKQADELAESDRKRKQEISAMTSRVTEALGREFGMIDIHLFYVNQLYSTSRLERLIAIEEQ